MSCDLECSSVVTASLLSNLSKVPPINPSHLNIPDESEKLVLVNPARCPLRQMFVAPAIHQFQLSKSFLSDLSVRKHPTEIFGLFLVPANPTFPSKSLLDGNFQACSNGKSVMSWNPLHLLSDPRLTWLGFRSARPPNFNFLWAAFQKRIDIYTI